MKCRSCGGENFTSILNLGLHPWCNDFLTKEEVGAEKFYPLHLVYCDSCELLQLDHTVPKETMFKQHDYVSGTTKTLRNHFLRLAQENKAEFNLCSDDLIIDIGGNDGTQLQEYQRIGLTNVVNIESADNIAELSRQNNVPVINEFFNEETVMKNFKKGEAKLINASGVFFHLEELHSVIRGINYVLADDGVFIVQFMYAGTMIEKLNFDTIYHEHLCYYTLISLMNLLVDYDLEVFDAYPSDIHSGSIIAKVYKKKFSDKLDIMPHTGRFIETLNKDYDYNKDSFINFGKYITSIKDRLKNFLSVLKESGQTIYAYGAPAKGNTLLNYFEIDNTLIDKCVEVNELKIGKYLPKSHIPIIKESKEDLPNYYLLLSHNFEKEILEKNKDIIEKGVKFIIPFPEIKIVGGING